MTQDNKTKFSLFLNLHFVSTHELDQEPPNPIIKVERHSNPSILKHIIETNRSKAYKFQPTKQSLHNVYFFHISLTYSSPFDVPLFLEKYIKSPINLNVYAMIQKSMKSGDGYQSVYKFYNTIEGIKLEEG
jgi:hypothetical protein